MENKEQFGSRFAAIAAMAGSAIGLGNIWRFPYMVGEYGGAAFIFIYIISSFLLSVPIFFAEFIIGRRSGANCLGAMRRLAPRSRWRLLGILCILTPSIILSYYAVVGGWSFSYLLRAFTLDFPESFGSFTASPWQSVTAFAIYMAISCIIVAGGVKKGIGRFSKLAIPVLFVLIVVLAIYSVCLPGSSAGVEYLVKPDWSKVTTRTFVNAIGQSFYSISLGMGIIITYASYVSKKENIILSGTGTAISDLFFALIAGFAIMPAVFAAGIEPGSGPGLIFDTLPFIFTSMSESAPLLGKLVAIIFFLAVAIAALTSSVSLIEVPVAWLTEEKGFKRGKATLLVFLVTGTIGALCALGFGPLAGVKIFGHSLFECFDLLSCNVLLPLGGLLCVLFVGWKMKPENFRDEFTNGGSLKFNEKIFGVIRFLIRYVAPIAVILIFLSNFI
jgi:NSS family neurotransmitter:Na+ symporter